MSQHLTSGWPTAEHLICHFKHLICYHHQYETSHLYCFRETTSHLFLGHDVNISFDPLKDKNISYAQFPNWQHLKWYVSD